MHWQYSHIHRSSYFYLEPAKESKILSTLFLGGRPKEVIGGSSSYYNKVYKLGNLFKS